MNEQCERASSVSGTIRQHVLDMLEHELRVNVRAWDRFDKAQFIKTVRACLNKDVNQACSIVYHRHIEQ